ncbi:Glycosyltransferase family 90 protein [Aspergillus sp. HF37]|nr:Glycosyltransferase family 90 protein [Aspergillus sp. HF37]
MIYDGISPFWKLSGQKVLRIMNDVQNTPDSELWHCTFSGYQATTHCNHAYRAFDRDIELLFDKLLGGLRGVLPDLRFLANHFDEPRVLIPPALGDQFSLTDMSKRHVWDTLTKFCSGGNSSSARIRQKVETFGLPFVTDPMSAMDLCRYPEYYNMHGLLLSPTSFRPIEGRVPVLSTGTPSTMGDILYPSPAYVESEFQYAGAHDVNWNKKRNNLY